VEVGEQVYLWTHLKLAARPLVDLRVQSVTVRVQMSGEPVRNGVVFPFDVGGKRVYAFSVQLLDGESDWFVDPSDFRTFCPCKNCAGGIRLDV
jgi:hypothetical protein